ncbi:hypothetical protein [Ideonella sp.]
MAAPVRPRWLRGAAWVGALVVLGAVFAAYRDPHTVVDLANRVWACF